MVEEREDTEYGHRVVEKKTKVKEKEEKGLSLDRVGDAVAPISQEIAHRKEQGKDTQEAKYKSGELKSIDGKETNGREKSSPCVA